MKLYANIDSERGKTINKSGNEFILVNLTVNREVIGQIELYYNDDINSEDKCDEDEWLLKFRQGDDEDNDWVIIAQGNTIPEKITAKL
jgi:hypothetical protein